MESRRCRPILGKSACEGMGVVEIKDSNAIWRPKTIGVQVFSVEDVMFSSKPLTKEQVIEMFPDVSMRASVYLRASTTSVLTIQPSQFSALPDEFKSLFAIKSKKPWRNYTVQRSFNQCQRQRPGSHLC